MTLQQMKSICAVVKWGSFSLASEKIHLSQSAVSKHVSALEQEMDFPILDRSGGALTLTPEGKRIMVELWQMIHTYNRLEQVVSDIHLSQETNTGASIPLCGIPVMEELEMMEGFDAFLAEHPHQRLDLQIRDEGQLLVDLDASELELVFCSDLMLDKSRYTCYPYRQQSFAVYVAIHHPLAEREAVTMAELRDYQLVLPARESMLLSPCIAACQRSGFRPEISLTTNRPVLALGYIKYNDNVYVSLDLERPAINPTTHKKLILLDGPSFQFVFAHRRETVLSQNTQQFLDWMLGESLGKAVH